MPSSRDQLLHQLKKYEPIDKNDRQQAERIVDFVETTPDCFERHHLAGHITGSAWVINHAGTHVLLTHHKKLNKWLQLGGHADGDSNIADAALREAQEESGLSDIQLLSTDIFDVDVHLIPPREKEPEHFHYDIRYLFSADHTSPLHVSNESNKLAWVKLNNLEATTTEESMRRMKRKWEIFSTKSKRRPV